MIAAFILISHIGEENAYVPADICKNGNPLPDHLPYILIIDRKDRDQRTKMKDHIKKQSYILHTKKNLKKRQMSGAAHRQKLRDTLNDTHQNCFQ